MGVLSFVLAIGLGFGLACLIFASLLSKSNDIGNSIGDAAHYTVGISYDRSVDRLKRDERDTFGTGYFREEELNRPEPESNKLVEQKK
jgi:hypothetical protein